MDVVFFFQAEDGIRDGHVTGVQTCALPIFADDKGFGYIERAGAPDLHVHYTAIKDQTGHRTLLAGQKVEFEEAEEIGRASCRERVERWETEVSVKEKNRIGLRVSLR